MKKKTVKVAWLKEKVNHFLKHSPEKDQEARIAVAALLETVLHETDSYHGFNYVKWLEGGCDEWHAAGEPDFPEKDAFLGDQTRRVYF